MLMLSERVKETTHRTLPGLNALNWQCQAHWFLTWGVGGGGLAVPPAVWARGKTAESVEQGSGFWGEHGSHCPGPASTPPPPTPPLPASLFLLSGHWAAKPRTSNHSFHLSLEVQRVLFFLYYFWKGLAPTPFLHHQACRAGNTIKTKLTFTVWGDTMA